MTHTTPASASRLYAREYASLFPSEVGLRELVIPAPSAVHGQLAATVAALVVVGAVGQVRDVEPGRGSVCAFGDAIYEFPFANGDGRHQLR